MINFNHNYFIYAFKLKFNFNYIFINYYIKMFLKNPKKYDLYYS